MVEKQYILFMNISSNKHFSYDELVDYLENKKQFSMDLIKHYKNHLNNCNECWEIWNKVRWDKAEGSKGLSELREYLGDHFIQYFDSSWAIADDWIEASPSTEEEIKDFYKNTSHYLYNLTIWDDSGDRDDFSDDFKDLQKQFGVTSLLDYGCGVGVDGLKALDQGMEVFFVDFDNPSTKFLNWRLKERGYSPHILNVELLDKYPDADVFWAIDVLEHMVDPLETVRKLSDKTKVYIHRSEFSNTNGGRHPCHLSFDEMKLAQALSDKGFENIPWSVLSVWVKK